MKLNCIWCLVHWALWHVNPCGLSNDNLCLYIHIYICKWIVWGETLFLNKPEIICLHKDKWFQVLLSNINNLIQDKTFVCTQLNGFKYDKWLNSSIWPIYGTLRIMGVMAMKGYSTFPNTSKLEFPHQMVLGHIQDTHGREILPLWKGAISIFYSSCWLSF